MLVKAVFLMLNIHFRARVSQGTAVSSTTALVDFSSCSSAMSFGKTRQMEDVRKCGVETECLAESG